MLVASRKPVDEIGHSQDARERTEPMPSKSGPIIDVRALNKSFNQGDHRLAVLDSVDFRAAEGEFVSIIGPSGCGKSTLLNIVAGLDEPMSGILEIHGKQDPRRLGTVGYMQQKDLLLPWRTVMGNAVIGLELQGVSKREARARADALLDQFGLRGFEDEYPSALSGGMRQRAAFLRTVLANQKVFLLDEPFGALDALNRSQIHEWLLSLWRELNKTIVMVTHDVDEAIFLSDRVYVMSARPGTMTLDIPIDLPRPRKLEMLTSPAFVDLKAKLLATIRAEDASKQPGDLS
ncbi:MAG: ABC transporter ATP-binding protein [SAR202 cluster bacterium]|jgi:ABC-type nitrate/sulfonate/bicarbonate transport system ATPase subunit|nr:ABC transporter ATP-binding protein [SAR202 cluster bacterium]MDP7412726.1 ABC transporter ATP-binding protein [SAR202 cluster bacterium]|tara:strand:- start:3066 stop:3938 length:873 start_codon:yes stop_codon:yes gene_type:complete